MKDKNASEFARNAAQAAIAAGKALNDAITQSGTGGMDPEARGTLADAAKRVDKCVRQATRKNDASLANGSINDVDYMLIRNATRIAQATAQAAIDAGLTGTLDGQSAMRLVSALDDASDALLAT